MKKIVFGFVSIAAVISLMLNYGPIVLQTAGDLMFDAYDQMLVSVMPGNKAPDAEYANQTLDILNNASQTALGELDQISNDILTGAEDIISNGSNGETDSPNDESDETITAFINEKIDRGAAIAWDFVTGIAGISK